MIDAASIRMMQGLGAALSTLHQAHRRGARVVVEGRPGEPWTITVDAVHLGVLADSADWALPTVRRAAHQAVNP